MTSDRWRPAATLFARALELPDAERDAFLVAECAGDDALLERVRAMLRVDRTSTPVLDATPDVLASAVDVAVPFKLEGRRLGPYTIVEVIGRGGMGIVCLAVRDDVGMRVAIKLVAGGLGAPEVVARFHQERRLLAQLEHPNIARLLDAGVADDGTPWLAMEYAPGEPIDVYCDVHRLSVKRRLALFERVADAVAYAHRHLIVHRDIKPGNILVSPDGQPRLLDFGIAKLLDDSHLDEQPLTRTGLRFLTPQYASPEQLRNDPVSTASDVYQLGGLLFELLTGRPPHPERAELRLSPQGNVVTKPSRSIGPTQTAPGAATRRSQQAATSIAEARATTPDRLRRTLAGDLDNIVLKATDQDPARRYATARDLADDVRRHREGLPIVARAPTLRYRAQKFVTRHRAGTAVAAAALVALVGFGFALRRQAQRVQAERVRAEQVSNLLADLFAGADPEVAQGDTLTVVSLLDRGTARIRADSMLDPLVRGRLLQIVAGAYQSLGREHTSVSVREDVVAALRRAVPITDSTLLHATAALGGALQPTEPERGRGLLHRADSVARTLGPERRLELASVLQTYGLFLQSEGDRAGARDKYEEALAIYRSLPNAPPAIERTLHDLGYLAYSHQELDAAERFWRETLERRRARLGPDHSSTASAMLSLSQVLVATGRLEEAEALITHARAVHDRVYPQANSYVVVGLLRMADLLEAKGELAASESVYRRAIDAIRVMRGDSSTTFALAAANLAAVVQGQGRIDEAAALHRAALDIYERLHDDLSTAITRGNLAYNAFLRQDLDESVGLYRRAIPVLDSVYRGTTNVKNTLFDYAWALVLDGQCDEAEGHLRRTMRLDSLDRATTGRLDVRPLRTLGWCLMERNEYDEAEKLFVEAYRVMLDELGPANAFTRAGAANLVDLYTRMGRPADADRYRETGG